MILVLFLVGVLDGSLAAFTGFQFGGMVTDQGSGFSTGAFQDSDPLALIAFEPEVEEIQIFEGLTPAKVVIEKVVAYPDSGQEDEVVLRNEGGKIADLTGWAMTDSKVEPLYIFGEPGCEANATINPQDVLVITPVSDINPCGFPFGISFRDAVVLYDTERNIVSNVSWDSSEKGSAIRLINDAYVQILEIGTVMDILDSIEEFSFFSGALKSVGMDKVLTGKVNPEYAGVELPSPPSPDYTIEFPWWFGFATDRTSIPPPPPPPPPPPSPPVGVVPALGPYTILAPTNAAFNDLLLLLGGGRARIPFQAFLKLPELEDILLYHIYYGDYTSDFMFNNTGIVSALGSEVVVMKDPRWTEGKIALNDACVDKPTTGYPCDQQLEFNKCYEPFMISPLASGWQGGFCQKTCGRCTCNDAEGGTCAKIEYADVVAANGVVHGISRVMFPPPIFDQVAEEDATPLPEAELAVLSSMSVGELPILPSLPVLPSLGARA